jgi:mycothiol synthase
MSESAPDNDWLPALIVAARATDGQPPFSDQSLVDLRTGVRRLVSIDSLAAAIVAPGEAEFVVHPDARGRGHGTTLLETLLSNSPGELLIWAHGDHPAARALAASHGLVPVRELLHFGAQVAGAEGSSTVGRVADTDSSATVGRVADTEGARVSRPLRLTIFRPGIDEAEWVALNALIFAAHPEQGSVTADDLAQLETESWFSPDDFLVVRDREVMVGYCWLKVEQDRGEFYVVGVHPDLQGSGWGGRLFDAGLARMAEQGIRSAHLYVEGDNEAALRLYRARGFEQDSIDVQYRAAAAR